MGAHAIQPDQYFEAVDASRGGPAGAMPGSRPLCASYGKQFAAPGFAMCVACRDAAGLESDEKARREADELMARQRAQAVEQEARKTRKRQEAARMGAWSEHDVATLEQMAKDGKTAREVAEVLGRSETAVRQKAGAEGMRFGRKGGRVRTEPGPLTETAHGNGDEPSEDVPPMIAECGFIDTGGATPDEEHEQAAAPSAEAEPDCDNRMPAECEAEPHEDCPLGYPHGAIEEADLNADEPVEERECPECGPDPAKRAVVTVEVTGIAAVKLRLRDLEETTEILAERVVELERMRDEGPLEAVRRALRPAERPYALDEAEVRSWARGELVARKRMRFRTGLLEAILAIEDAVFDESAAEEEGDAA